MKRIILSTILASLIVFALLAAPKTSTKNAPTQYATLSINIPQNDVPRVSAAYGSMLGLGRPATLQEVQSRVQDDIMNYTKAYERSAYTPPPMDMQSPTPVPSPTPTPTP